MHCATIVDLRHEQLFQPINVSYSQPVNNKNIATTSDHWLTECTSTKPKISFLSI